MLYCSCCFNDPDRILPAAGMTPAAGVGINDRSNFFSKEMHRRTIFSRISLWIKIFCRIRAPI